MFNVNQLTGKNLEFLVRTALMNRELSPGAAVAIEKYQQSSSLSTVEQRQLQILDSAIADGCVIPI